MHHGMGETCPSCGCDHGQKMGGGMKALFMILPCKIMMHSDELGISEEQVEAMRKRHSEARKQMIGIGSQIKMDMIDVQNAIMREEIDMPLAEAKIREISKLKGDKYVAMVQAINDLRHILNHEQRMKVKEMVMSWFKKGGMPGMEAEEGESED